MAYDANAVFQAEQTVTATTHSAWIDMKTIPGTPRGGMVARFLTYSDVTTGAGSYVYSLEQSPNNDNSDVRTVFQGPSVILATGANTTRPVIDGPFIMASDCRYVRATITVTSGSGAQSVTYQVDRGQSFPG